MKIKVILCATVVMLLSGLAVAAGNPLSKKLIDGNGKTFMTAKGQPAVLEDIGLGKVALGVNSAVRVVPWSTMPGEIAQMGYAGERLFFATVKGKIWEYDKTGKRSIPALVDVRAIRPAFSMKAAYSGSGLRGFAPHPDFIHNGILYTVHLEIGSGERATHGDLESDIQSVIGEWHINKSGDAPTFRSVLRVGYKATDHIGGQIGFNPTAKPGDADYGMLYATFGDGGGECSYSEKCINQFGKGQDFSSIQAGIIRINPLQKGNLPYSIPTDNPYIGKHDAENRIPNELFAKGFRNPATLMFDLQTGRIFTGDISQNSIEEINLVERGKNYGWGTREGTWLYTDLTDSDNSLRYIPLGNGTDVSAKSTTYYGKDSSGKEIVFNKINRQTDGFTSPVLQFTHAENGGIAAVVTGTVYRGTDVPALKGLFLFSSLSHDKIYYAKESELINNESPAAIFELKLLDEKSQPTALGAVISNDAVVSKNNVAASTTSETEGDELSKVGGMSIDTDRANIRFGQDGHGKMYIVSKHNNVIYQLQSSLQAP